MPRFFKRCVWKFPCRGRWEGKAIYAAGWKGKKEEQAEEKQKDEREADALCADPFFRLFKFPQMDFEMAIWEMTSLLIAPKKVFRSIYYHVT